MDGPGSTGDVVNIRARAGYRPDYKRLASGQITAARAKLGLSHAEFADYLGDLLGWTVTPAAVERWEQGSIPPGDVVLASAVAAQDMPGDVLAFPLNATAERTAALLSAIGPAVDYVGDPTEAVLPYADRGLARGAELRSLGAYYSLPSETNKYTHVFVAEPVVSDGPARGDTEIEKYFDMSIVVMPFGTALKAIGDSISGTETVTALMLAHRIR